MQRRRDEGWKASDITENYFTRHVMTGRFLSVFRKTPDDVDEPGEIGDWIWEVVDVEADHPRVAAGSEKEFRTAKLQAEGAHMRDLAERDKYVKDSRALAELEAEPGPLANWQGPHGEFSADYDRAQVAEWLQKADALIAELEPGGFLNAEQAEKFLALALEADPTSEEPHRMPSATYMKPILGEEMQKLRERYEEEFDLDLTDEPACERCGRVGRTADDCNCCRNCGASLFFSDGPFTCPFCGLNN